jgi:hypothetical protein
VSYFSAGTTVGANVGGAKTGRGPRTQDSRTSTRKQKGGGRQGIPESLNSP